MASTREDISSDHRLSHWPWEGHSSTALGRPNNAVPSSPSARNNPPLLDPFANVPVELCMDILALLTTPDDIYSAICASRAMFDVLMENSGFRSKVVRTMLETDTAELKTDLRTVAAAAVLVSKPLLRPEETTMEDWKAAFFFLWWKCGLRVYLCCRDVKLDEAITGLPEWDSVVEGRYRYLPRAYWKPWVVMLGKHGLISGDPCW